MKVEERVNKSCDDSNHRTNMKPDFKWLIEQTFEKISKVYFLIECFEYDDRAYWIDYYKEQNQVTDNQIEIVIEPNRNYLIQLTETPKWQILNIRAQ